MKRIINIGNQKVEMLCNAASPYRYHQCFHEDLFSLITGDPENSEAINAFMKLGYIFAKQAEGEISTVSEDGYYDWLEQFELMDYINAVGDIGTLYTHTVKGTAVPK